MKKYFMAGTEDEVKFGDMLELDFTQDMKNGNVKHHHMEVKFIPELVEMLLDSEVIEERGSLSDTYTSKEFREAVADDIEDLLKKQKEFEDRVIELEGIIAELKSK